MSSYSNWYGGTQNDEAVKRGKRIHKKMAAIMRGKKDFSIVADEIYGFDVGSTKKV